MLTVDPRELMTRAQAGDLDAFAQLYAAYRARLAAYAEKRLPGHGDDIAQDVFVRALGNLNGWRNQGKDPLAWLFTICGRACIDRTRSAHYRRVIAVEDPGSWLEAPARYGPEAVTMQELTRDAVSAALGDLTERQRQALTAFHMRGLTLVQIAVEMDCTVAAVKALMYKGRLAMARTLAGLVAG